MVNYANELRKKGINVTEYVPYGTDAFAYSVRRAKENKKLRNSPLFWPFFEAYKVYYH